MRAVDGVNTVRPNGSEVRASVCGVDDGIEVEMIPEECGDETTEMRKVRRMQNPMKPSAAQIEEHELTHLPFRSWCWICVRGKSKNASHFKNVEEKTVPELHFDYMFIGPKDQPGDTLKCLVAREALTRMTLAMVVPNKGANQYVAKRVVAFLTEVGCVHKDVIVKSDRRTPWGP